MCALRKAHRFPDGEFWKPLFKPQKNIEKGLSPLQKAQVPTQSRYDFLHHRVI
jgi:hypothetical protein